MILSVKEYNMQQTENGMSYNVMFLVSDNENAINQDELQQLDFSSSGSEKNLGFTKIPYLLEQHPKNRYALCTNVNISATPNDQLGTWTADCTYETRHPVYYIDRTPTDENAKIIGYYFNNYSKQIYKTIEDDEEKPIKNYAGMDYPEPTEIDKQRLVVSISTNIAHPTSSDDLTGIVFNVTDIPSYINGLSNQDKDSTFRLLGINTKPDKTRILKVQPREMYYILKTYYFDSALYELVPYYNLVIDVEILPDEETYQIVKDEYSFYEKKDGKLVQINVDGYGMSDPWPIKADGTAYTSSEISASNFKPLTNSYDIYPEIDYNKLTIPEENFNELTNPLYDKD